MKKLLTILGLALLPGVALAGQGKQTCTAWVQGIDAATMESSRSFEIEASHNAGALGTTTVLISLTDANTSITRFDLDVTTSRDDNTTDYTLQTCAVAAGVCTSSDATWQKASPGSVSWAWRVDTEGMEDTEYTFSVGAGSGAAADLITVWYRECTKGG